MNTFSIRACYFVAADGQSDVLLTGEDQTRFSDAELIEDAVSEAYNAGLIGDVTGLTEQDVRDGLRIGDYNL